MARRHQTRQEKYRLAHPEVYAAASKRWRENHPDRARTSWRVQYQKLRKRVLDQYGCKCNRCGFSDWRALQIDHVHGGGTREHQAIRNAGIYRRALKLPKEYQVLCSNCNWIKRYENSEHIPRKDDPASSGIRVTAGGEIES